MRPYLLIDGRIYYKMAASINRCGNTLFMDFQCRDLERQHRLFFRSQIRYFCPKCFFTQQIDLLYENIVFVWIFDYIYGCASIHRCTHLLTDAVHLLIDGRIYKYMRQHPFYRFPVQEFGTPKSILFSVNSKLAIFRPKCAFFAPK